MEVKEKVEEQENAEESQATEEQLSAVEDLSDEQVDKLVKGESLEEEKGDETEEGAEPPVKEGEADTKPAEKDESTEEPEKEELKEDEPVKAETDDEKIEVSKAEWEKMQAHAQTQADFEQRRGNEMGELRTENRKLKTDNLKMMPPGEEFTPQEKERLDELASTDMLAWDKEKNRLIREKQAARDALVQDQKDEESGQQLAYLEKTSPEWEKSKDSVRDYLEGNKLLNKEQAAQFAGNPSGWQWGGFIYRVAEDAAKNESLKTEVVELTEKLASLQENIAKNASKSGTMANIGTSVTDSPGSDKPNLDEVEDLSDAALKKLLPK